ncbi:hypothetical protein H2200_011560 [Cladophialophora chaetospira]|uniref:Uncharacterized protein n=1 Tax=Cladophialophora chaetospira TaxID=386627 RepID=A0AA38WZM8_9EURO|nr:hypothetical protein H2200_011560 [Cladophialophora chaetospira]
MSLHPRTNPEGKIGKVLSDSDKNDFIIRVNHNGSPTRSKLRSGPTAIAAHFTDFAPRTYRSEDLERTATGTMCSRPVGQLKITLGANMNYCTSQKVPPSQHESQMIFASDDKFLGYGMFSDPSAQPQWRHRRPDDAIGNHNLPPDPFYGPWKAEDDRFLHWSNDTVSYKLSSPPPRPTRYDLEMMRRGLGRRRRSSRHIMRPINNEFAPTINRNEILRRHQRPEEKPQLKRSEFAENSAQESAPAPHLGFWILKSMLLPLQPVQLLWDTLSSLPNACLHGTE